MLNSSETAFFHVSHPLLMQQWGKLAKSPWARKWKFNNGAYGLTVFFICVSSFHESVLRMLLGIEILQVSIFHLYKKNPRWLLHTVASTLSVSFVFHSDFCHQHLTWKRPRVYVGQVWFSGFHFLKKCVHFFFSVFVFFNQCCDHSAQHCRRRAQCATHHHQPTQMARPSRGQQGSNLLDEGRTASPQWWLNSFYF